MKHKLAHLFQDYDITGVCFDSRKVSAGNIFFAIRGARFDGRLFIDTALKAGARLAVTDDASFFIPASAIASSAENAPISPVSLKPEELTIKDRVMYVGNIRYMLGVAAGLFYPKLPSYLAAVTGTNGKTSVVSYCQQLFELLGQNSASIGTLGVRYTGQGEEDTSLNGISEGNLTTIDQVAFRQVLNRLAVNNINYVAFEASSHGLSQFRLGDIKVASAAFTSFTHDHLDYHATLDDYLLAKLKLFTDHLAVGGQAVISSEMACTDFIQNYLRDYPVEVITVGRQGQIKITSANHSVWGQDITFFWRGEEYSFTTGIAGSFQAINLVTAALLVHGAGFDLSRIVEKLTQVEAVKGRLERVTGKDFPFHIFIDYAHTPDALASSLKELGRLVTAQGKLKVVFGCGGNRDSFKRKIMGDIACRFADEVIVTDDNPRMEDPELIRQEILAGCNNKASLKGLVVSEIPSREEAIVSSVKSLRAGDILLIAGKGHEDYQIIGSSRIDFSDTEVARKALEEKIKTCHNEKMEKYP